MNVRYACRALVRQPGFTAIIVATLALGIGANTMMFSLVNAVLLRPLPYRDPDNLFFVWETLRGRRAGVTAPDYTDWLAQAKSFTGLAAGAAGSVNLTGGGDPERLPGARVTGNYFEVLGVAPVIGRGLAPSDDRLDAPRVVALSEGLWKRRFAGDPAVVGRTIMLDRIPHTVIGVMPASLQLRSASEQLWTPLLLTPRDLQATGSHRLRVVGRLRPDTSRDAAQAEMQGIARRLEKVRPWSNTGWSVALTPVREFLVGDVSRTLLVLLGAVGFVLLIACANVANLLLARAASREREIAVRCALGASRLRIAGQLLVESVLLALLGAGAGLLLAAWGAGPLVRLLPDSIPRLATTSLDGMVLTFTLSVAVVTGILFGLAPGVHATRRDLLEALKSGLRESAGGPGRTWMRNAFVVGEIAIALVLLTGAGLLIHSFWRLQSVHPGFQSRGLAAIQMALPDTRYRTPQEASVFYERLLERATGLPGVQTAALASHLPLGSSGFSLSVFVEGRPFAGPDTPTAFYRAISPEYFSALSIPLRSGRVFTDADREGSPRVAIVNETMARRFFPGETPIGKRFTLDDNEKTAAEIVGVVGDVKHMGLESDYVPEIFIPYLQAPAMYWQWTGRSLNLVARSAGAPQDSIAALRAAVWEADRDLPVYNVTTLERMVEESTGSQKTYMLLLGTFAAVALALAAVGIYGVMSYLVAERTREIGVRIALGASGVDVLRLVLSRGMTLAALGLGLGLAGAFGLTRFLKGFLFGVQPTDPLTFAVVAGFLLAVAAVACWLPAQRATKVDPLEALRYE